MHHKLHICWQSVIINIQLIYGHIQYNPEATQGIQTSHSFSSMWIIKQPGELQIRWRSTAVCRSSIGLQICYKLLTPFSNAFPPDLRQSNRSKPSARLDCIQSMCKAENVVECCCNLTWRNHICTQLTVCLHLSASHRVVQHALICLSLRSDFRFLLSDNGTKLEIATKVRPVKTTCWANF